MDTYLSHHGILGQKWGVRRYQNTDGSLTEAGKKRIDRLHKKIDSQNEKAHKSEKKLNRQTIRYENNVADQYAKAAKLRKKEYGFFTTNKKAAELEYKAKKIEVRADAKVAEINRAKADIRSAAAKVAKYNAKIADLDTSAISYGQEYLDELLKRV